MPSEPGISDRLEATLVSLLRCDTSVAQGSTEVFPGDPKIRAAVEKVIDPLVASLRPDEVRRNDLGDVVARVGPPSKGGLLIQTYVVAQHANLASNATKGIVEDGKGFGISGRAAVGRGATQIKGPMAGAFEAVARIRRDRLNRPVWLAINTEGMSSHSGSERVFDLIDYLPGAAVISIGTDLRVSLGNRGRVDVRVVTTGDSFHSSQPWLGTNAIAIAADVLAALPKAPLPDDHPRLGPVSITPYSVSCYPIAPHTVPSSVTITLDRLLLPGEQPTGAVASLAAYLAMGGVKVDEGKHMLPVIVDEDELLVMHLRAGIASAGRTAEVFYSSNAFDAGYSASLGIPTVMFGPGRRHFFGDGLLGIDAIAVADCDVAADALAFTATALCGD